MFKHCLNFPESMFCYGSFKLQILFYKAGIEIFEDGPIKNESTGSSTKDET